MSERIFLIGVKRIALFLMLLWNVESFGQFGSPAEQKDTQQAQERLAVDLYRSGDYKSAAALLEKLYDQHPSQYLYNYYLNCLFTLQNYKEAERLVKKQRKHSPSSYRYLIDQAYIYKQTGQNKKSSKLIDDAIQGLPVERNSVMLLASALQSRGFYDKAINVYQTAMEQSQGTLNFNYEMANAYLYSGNYPMVFSCYLDQIESQPEDAQRIRNQLQNILRMDVDDNLSEDFRVALLQRVQGQPKNKTLAEMVYWYAMQKEEFDMALRQAVSMVKRFDSGDENLMELGQVSQQHQQYDISRKAFEQVMNKKDQTPWYLEASTGYYQSSILEADNNPETSVQNYEKLASLGKKLINSIGVNDKSVPILKQYAHIEAFRLNHPEIAMDDLTKALDNTTLGIREQASLKMELADILLAEGSIWDATLLYSQVENSMKNEPVGHEAKLKNALVFYYVGEFAWSQARLDVLKSATSKLISNDAISMDLFINDMLEEDTLGFALRKFAAADLYTYRQKWDSALIMLDKVAFDPSRAAQPYQLFKKAQVLESIKKYEEADSLYVTFIKRYPDHIKADNALYLLAELRRNHLHDFNGAMDSYFKLMTDYPDSFYTGEARVRYRELSKENVESEK